ncbi:TetR-like C-terminal domain-containing protein [Bifidobacterium sp.]|uniref:TetR-like C-terminal domain-containing protein n=1 Tax=Bifidobacterium sp. TaxID=41200 RepID=UPI0025C02AA5|nr:TetR-like C-terminal domain-containing protein [Bifidobacterium sp.]
MRPLFTRSDKSPAARLTALPTAPPPTTSSAPPSANVRRGHGGRPRSESSRRAILDAVAALVTTVTPAQITIAAIAARAGTGKSTIYRWWTSRAELLFDALARITVPTLDFPDEADTATALATQLEALQRLFADPYLGRLIIALTVEAQENPATAQSLRRLWLAPRRDSAARILRRGIARGEIRPDIDIEIAIDQLFAPLYHRALYYYGQSCDGGREEVPSAGDENSRHDDSADGDGLGGAARRAAKAVEQFIAGAAPRLERNTSEHAAASTEGRRS